MAPEADATAEKMAALLAASQRANHAEVACTLAEAHRDCAGGEGDGDVHRDRGHISLPVLLAGLARLGAAAIHPVGGHPGERADPEMPYPTTPLFLGALSPDRRAHEAAERRLPGSG